jgi:hypothetical protein
MAMTKQTHNKALLPQLKITADDFQLDESGNLIIDIQKVTRVLNLQSVSRKKAPLKSGISPY